MQTECPVCGTPGAPIANGASGVSHVHCHEQCGRWMTISTMIFERLRPCLHGVEYEMTWALDWLMLALLVNRQQNEYELTPEVEALEKALNRLPAHASHEQVRESRALHHVLNLINECVMLLGNGKQVSLMYEEQGVYMKEIAMGSLEALLMNLDRHQRKGEKICPEFFEQHHLYTLCGILTSKQARCAAG